VRRPWAPISWPILIALGILPHLPIADSAGANLVSVASMTDGDTIEIHGERITHVRTALGVAEPTVRGSGVLSPIELAGIVVRR
jgi:endonuclease YncB( thermonuclease family)